MPTVEVVFISKFMQILIMILGGVSGAVATWLLQKYGVSAVVASCLVGLTGALIGHLTANTHLPMVIFAGSFVGMTALHLTSLPLTILAGASVGLLYSLTLNLFSGYGGKLGTIAFVVVLVVVWLGSFLFKA